MSDESHLVFVYGTLRRGASNAFRMEGAEFVRKGLVRGRLYRVDWYPGLVLDDQADWVAGEFWRIHERKLHELDAFEGLRQGESEGDEYRRIRFSVEECCFDPSGLRGEHAWMWEWKGETEGLRLVTSGDWLN